jgi:hypothetical protein
MLEMGAPQREPRAQEWIIMSKTILSPSGKPGPTEAPPPSRPLTGREHLQQLKASGFVGIWKGREDIGDSSAFARRLRESVETRADRFDRTESA